MTPAEGVSNPGAVSPGLQHHPPPEAPAETGVRPWTTGGVGYNTSNAPEPRCIGRRVDALVLAFRGQVKAEVLGILHAAGEKSARVKTACACELAPGVSVVVHPASRSWRGPAGIEGWWRLETDEVTVKVDTGAAEGWTVEVTPRALLLGRDPGGRGWQAAALADRLAELLLIGAQGLPFEGQAPTVDTGPMRARRIDLSADFVGFDLASIDPGAWVTPRRVKVKDMGSLATFSHEGRRTGFMLGKSAVALRVYDKTEEIQLPENAGDKRDEEHARWTAAGWDGSETVVRVEFQVRGDALDQFELRDPSKLLASLDALWCYLTRIRADSDTPWVRLIVPGSASRRERCAIDPRWRAVQRVLFDGQQAPRPRVYRRAPMGAKRAAALLFKLAAVGYAQPQGRTMLDELDSFALATPIEDWTPEQTRRYLDDATGLQLTLAFETAKAEWVRDLHHDHGSEANVVRYMHEVRKAAKARASSLEALLAARFERAALASTSRREAGAFRPRTFEDYSARMRQLETAKESAA